jgi:branched-subunit amino acid transport protein
MNEWLLIGLMALVTFVPRYLPFALAGRVRVAGWLERALGFVPIAVLTAIVAQASMIRDGAMALTLDNYHALAALVAFAVSLATRHLFLTILSGLAAFVLLNLFPKRPVETVR